MANPGQTTGATSDPAGALRANLFRQAAICHRLRAPFYGELLELMAGDVGERPLWELLGAHAAAPFEDVYPLRLLGGVHHMVLRGDAPDLARHYPSTGGDGDVRAAWPAFRALLTARPPAVVSALERPPQTNDVGRSASLVAGFLLIAAWSGLPLRLLELGASAGLNLHVDCYWYEQQGSGWGDAASPVRFVDLWEHGRPPFEAGAQIVARAGCDLDPIDPTSDDAGVNLRSYVWPDHGDRLARLGAALEVARAAHLRVERADAVDWLDQRLDQPAQGAATVVFHSIFWQYLSAERQVHVAGRLRAAGEAATPDAPLAWVRLEPAADMSGAELRVANWPGGQDRLVATAGFHFGPVRWLL